MRMGFHYHIPFIKKGDGYYTSGAIGVFIDSIAEQCTEIVCFLHTALDAEFEQMDYKLKQKNIRIIEIGSHDLFLKRITRSRKIKKIIQPYLASVDIMLIRAPSPLLPLFSSVSIQNDVPLAYLLVGDYVKSFEGANVKGWKKIILKNYFNYNKKRQDHFAPKALVFTNSRVLHNEYRDVTSNTYEIKTTTLTEKDFFEKKNANFHDPVELLYTGRIEPTKGLDEVLEAMKLLNEKGIDTKLNLVGWEDKKGYVEHLFQKARQFGMENNIVFHGKKQVGKELFSMYRNADIYVIASKGNEGFPRTIWEAMANSTPVIASNLGSIPHFLDNGKNVLLVESGSVADIADNIDLLLRDKELRKRLVKNAYILAKENTLEQQAKKLVNACKLFIENGKL